MGATPVTGAFRGRSVLVTGHTGFKGSWLVLLLHRLGAKVFGASLEPPTTPSHFELARIAELLEADLRGDVRDLGFVEESLARAQPQVIFHLAAQPLVRESYREPHVTFATNVMGTVNVLEAVRRRNASCVTVVVTSDKSYEEADLGRGYRESDRLGGRDPYSASKAAAEMVAASYRSSFGLAVATARAGNVIGGGDWASDRIVVDAVRALARREPVPVRNPSSTRPFQHVLDPLHGYLLLADRLREDARFATAWNFGPAEETTVAALVEQLVAAWGSGEWVDRSDPAAPHEAPRLSLDADRARRELAWSPRFSLEETIARTGRWYRGLEEGRDARALSLDDVARFEALR